MAYYPSFSYDYIRYMPKEEYFLRVGSYELKTIRDRFEHVQYSLDTRTINNDTRSVGENEMAFNIVHPYQQIDFPYYESIILRGHGERSEESKTEQEKLLEERERFIQIQKEVREKYARKE